MATTATTTATIVEVTGRQEEDNDADSLIVQKQYGYHPSQTLYVYIYIYYIKLYTQRATLSNLQLFYSKCSEAMHYFINCKNNIYTKDRARFLN